MAFCCASAEVADTSTSGRYFDERDVSKPRKCTDLLCLVVFVLFWFLLIFIASFAFVIGSPSRLIHGSDSFGNTCGYQNQPIGSLEFSGLDLTDRPYLFHFNPKDLDNSLKICVHKCPNKELNSEADLYRFYNMNATSLCRYDYNWTTEAPALGFPELESGRVRPSLQREQELMIQGMSRCPSLPVLPTKAILYRCIPELAVAQGKAFGHTVYDFISSYAPLKKIINDLMYSYKEMSLSLLVAVFFAFGSAFVIHFIAGIASWVILTLVSIALIALTAFFWYAYVDIRLNLDLIPLNSTFIEEDAENEQIVLTIAITTTVVSIILLLITCALRTRVRFVVALFKEAASCIRAMPLILLQPIWTLLCLLIFFVFWLTVVLAMATAEYASEEKKQLASVTIPSGMEGPRLASFTLIDYSKPTWVQYMWWYLIIAFIWTSEFILSCQQMVIAGAVSQWYFTRDKKNLNCPIGLSIRRLFLYHMGSIALGSFLITTLKVPRLVITYLHKKLKGYDNCLVRGVLRCCSCLLWIIEKFVQYLNRNAYTVIAIEGLDFCPSARIAFNAIVTNALRVAAINSVGDFILFLGKISVAAIGGFIGALLLKDNPMVHYWTVPVILVAIVSFWIAHCVLSVYEMIIDTLFLCFCEDYNKNDGSPGKEYYSPPSLMQFLTGEEVDTALQPLRSSNRRKETDI